MLARLLADKFSTAFGKPFIVENVPGAGGIVAANMVAKAQPDGYTLMFGDSSAMAINPALNPSLGYDPIKRFRAGHVAGQLAHDHAGQSDRAGENARSSSSRYAKKEPGKMSFSSAGAGSIHHLTMAIFADRNGIDLLHVPYRGGSAMVNGLLTGDIQVGWSGNLERDGADLVRQDSCGYCVSVLHRRAFDTLHPDMR